jgi:tetratricopeptide (TPR) repeat protein
VLASVLIAAAVTLVVWVLLPGRQSLRLDQLLASYDDCTSAGGLTIPYPFDESVFPPEIAPPTFRWEDANKPSDTWIVQIRFSDGQAEMTFESRTPEWTPAEEEWETIKRQSLERPARLTIFGVRRGWRDRVVSSGGVSFSTSRDEVGAPIFYREVNLPFVDAVKDPSCIRWRFGDVSSPSPPPVVLANLPSCGNCHSFSADGTILGMDIDYANDKGSYAMVPLSRQMVIEPSKIITWADYKREDGELTFGLLSQISPDGRYVVSTVKDLSVFVPRDDLAFSQLFFPIKGILAVYYRDTGAFRSLPGADDPEYVQSNPSWSPDGQTVVFARSRKHVLKRQVATGNPLLSRKDCVEFLEEGKTFLFDLYRIPFNGGKGGKAEPLAGASHNGMSNYFARYSPDGKWIVFCKAKSFMLLQPDSELYIMPSGGGEARRLRANRGRMNSWHSWSPNGKWLVFSSKVFSAYTQLFLTHIDGEGNSSPPVLLSRFTEADRAANIPEFVRARPDAIGKIQERFLSEVNYARLAMVNFGLEDWPRAEDALRKALALKPQNAETLDTLGIALAAQGKTEEAWKAFSESLRQKPNNTNVRLNMAIILLRQGRIEEAMAQYRAILAVDPRHVKAHLSLGGLLVNRGQLTEAVEHLRTAVGLDQTDVRAHYLLGLALQREGKLREALSAFHRALEQDPAHVGALTGKATIRASSSEASLRDGAEAVGLAQRACELSKYADPEALVALATAYAEAGRRPEAVMAASRAAAVARRSGNEALAQSIEKRFRH